MLNISWLTLILKADWKEDSLQISIYRIWPSYDGAEYLQLRFKLCCIVIVSSIFSRQMLLGSFYVFVIIILSIRVTMMEIFILTKLLICRRKKNAYCVENLRFFSNRWHSMNWWFCCWMRGKTVWILNKVVTPYAKRRP